MQNKSCACVFWVSSIVSRPIQISTDVQYIGVYSLYYPVPDHVLLLAPAGSPILFVTHTLTTKRSPYMCAHTSYTVDSTVDTRESRRMIKIE